MATDTLDPFDNIVDAPFDAALSERYLVYALSTITARSLPDVRDGLKPVHRRLLWAMRKLGLDPGSSYKKCASVVGEVIGKYHPHGDQSIYDALVRLAQPFSLRYPLIDGQGNFGNIDGDNPAAFRYTEARLTRPAVELMQGLDEGTVDFRKSFTGEDDEPELMPGLFPNLLANGASGIAVGMATSIPPHNVAELIDAATLLIEHPRAEPGELMAFVTGPDFPTGGVVADSAAAIADAYASGRGSFRVRARWHVEEQGRGVWAAIVTEIPYQTPKGKLIEALAALVTEKKLPILADVRDESDEAIRIVLEPRSRAIEPALLMESLFRLSDLEVRVPLNLNVLDADRTPGVMSLGQALAAWLAHQFEMLRRRTGHRLQRIADRVELLDGYIIAFLNLDRVIEIIRAEDEPKPLMMAEFGLTDRQAEAILNMRLRSLRKLEEMELRREREALDKERGELELLLGSEARQRTRLRKDLAALRDRYGPETEIGRRRTTIEEAAPARDIPLEAMIEREPVTVILSKRGWIRAMKGHGPLDTIKFKEGDALSLSFPAQTTDKLLLAAADGRVYTLAADRLPGARGLGEPVRLMVDLDGDTPIVGLFVARPDERILFTSTSGKGFVARAGEIVAETRKGRQVVNLKPPARLAVARPIAPEADHVAVIGENRKLLVFPLAELPEMVRGQGVTLQRYKGGGLADAIAFRLDEGLSWPMGGDSGRTRTETELSPWRGARGGAGRMPPRGFPQNNRFTG